MAEAATATATTVTMRRFPAPYRAMLAVSNDIDLTSIHRLRALHRFINTRAETPLGPGLGLDFANSFWLYKSQPGLPGWERLHLREAAVFEDYDGRTPTPYADELAAYARAGWADTLHAYGNFSWTDRIGVRFQRRHAERAVETLARLGLRLTVWTNHGDRNNRQNLGRAAACQGDDPASDAYHADLLTAAGMRFVHLPTPGGLNTPGFTQASQPGRLDDGQPVHAFPRLTRLLDDPQAVRRLESLGGHVGRTADGRPFAQVWSARQLHLQLAPAVLDHIVERGLFLAVGQHLGHQLSLRDFDGAAAEALRTLARYQERGLILVAATGRMLRYDANRRAARWRVDESGDRAVIDIEALEDAVDGRRAPTLDDVRGFAFDGPAGARLALAGRPIDEAEIERRPHGAGETVSVRWHAIDTTDLTTEFTERNAMVDVPGFPMQESQRARLGELNAQALDWLRQEKARRGEADPKIRYAIDYTIGRYAVGLEHYGRVMEKLGFTGRRRGLDVGSGSGHWVQAFAAMNGAAVGVERSPEFVEVAEGVAAATGTSEVAGSVVGDARRLAFPAESFDTAWSHGVIMFVEHDRALFELNRVLEPLGALYVGYTAIGHRLRVLEQSASLGRVTPPLRTTITVLFNNSLYRAGVQRTPKGRTRCYTREELQQTARLAGFAVVAAPGLQDSAERWRGHESTIDFLAEKVATPEAYLQGVVQTAGSGQEILAAANRATALGAPEAALVILEQSRLAPERRDVARARLAAQLKAGRLDDPDAAIAKLDEDGGNVARLLQGKILLDANRPGQATERLKPMRRDPEIDLLRIAALLFAGDVAGAETFALGAVERFPADLGCGAAYLRVLEAAGETDRLVEETTRFLDRIAPHVDPVTFFPPADRA